MRCARSRQRYVPNLPISDKGDLPGGGNVRRGPVAEFARRIPGKADRPYSLLCARRIVCGIGDLSFAVAFFPPDEYECLAVRAPGKLAQFLAVVRREVRKLARLELRAFRGPHVALPLIVEQPGDPLPRG